MLSLALHCSFKPHKKNSLKKHLSTLETSPVSVNFCLSLMLRNSSRPSACHDWTVVTPSCFSCLPPTRLTDCSLYYLYNSSHPPHHLHFNTGVTLMFSCRHTKDSTLPHPPPPLLWLCPPVGPQSWLSTTYCGALLAVLRLYNYLSTISIHLCC